MSTVWERIKQVLAEASARNSPVERAAYLDGACRGDDRLRAEVEQLLRAHDQAGAFLEDPVVPPQHSIIGLSAPLTEKPGDHIGHYKLLQQIGEGGCGVVYMAEQEEPIRRRVALKVIKLGMDTKQVIARFEAERQALALMDHPNIAKIFYAGITESPVIDAEGRARHSVRAARESSDSGAQGTDAPYLSSGRPYFVMELVRGVKITDYCDENNLSTEQRLDLFVQICHAIQHAHQKGIIHRDIKPSNILVTVNDGKPLPKIIDFGIAKATSGQLLADKTLFTAFEHFIGTPAYMSPEQAEMSTLDIDTRSDIYALGVLLYELLTGQTPFDAKELIAAGLNEMRRIIREQEPMRPSNRISTLEAADQTTVARRRHSEPPQLIHVVRGDLDWIVMKCLEKDRTRRYETANGLADDVVRHLHDEPVVARSPGRVYRFQKLVRRNKLVFAAGTAVVAALLIGLGMSTWLFWQEREAWQRAVLAEQKAKSEAAKSQQVAQFLKDMLQGAGPSVALGRDTTMLREILDKTAGRVGKDLKDQPEVEAELRNTLGWVYFDLGDDRTAEVFHRDALTLRRKLYGDEHREVADSLFGLGSALSRQGKWAEAEKAQRESLAIRRKLFGNDNLDTAQSLNALALVVSTQGKPAEAESMIREALSIQKQYLREPDPKIAWSLLTLATTLNNQGKLDEAETTQREALAMERELYGANYPTVALSLSQLGMVLARKGEFAEAEAALTESLAMLRELQASNYASLRVISFALARVLACDGKLAESEPLYREELAQLRKEARQGSVASQEVLAWRLATCILPTLRDGTAAVSFAERAVATTNRNNAGYLDTLAAAYAEAGQFAKAVATEKEAIALLSDEKRKENYKSRLKLYESETPYRERDYE